MLRLLITGADGFIGRNLRHHLAERSDVEVLTFCSSNGLDELDNLLKNVDFIIHLAGVNRAVDPDEFRVGNSEFTQHLCDRMALIAQITGKRIPLVYASSVQAADNSPYGISKKKAEQILLKLQKDFGNNIYIYRLPNVFGKWCRPNYNSVVATFCFNLAHNLPIVVHEASRRLALVHIDDVVRSILDLFRKAPQSGGGGIFTNPANLLANSRRAGRHFTQF